MAKRTKRPRARSSEHEAYVKRMDSGIMLLSKSDPWAAVAEAYSLADLKHPIRRHKPPLQKRSFK